MDYDPIRIKDSVAKCQSRSAKSNDPTLQELTRRISDLEVAVRKLREQVSLVVDWEGD